MKEERTETKEGRNEGHEIDHRGNNEGRQEAERGREYVRPDHGIRL